MSARKKMLLAAGTLTWLACLTLAFAALQQYSFVAGRAGTTTPAAADFLAAHRAPNRGLIVVATHPRCPCTRATLAELSELLARSPHNCDVILLDFTPKHPSTDWPAVPATRQLGPAEARVLADPEGATAAALGAHTSGHVVFVDPQGLVRFQGGLTISRGHRGRSPAHDAILAVLEGRDSAVKAAPVYGCALEPTCEAKLTP